MTLIGGFALGFIVFLVDLPAFGDTQWISDPQRGLGISFMMQAVWGFVGWSIAFVLVSFMTPAPAAAQVELTTWDRPLEVILHGPSVGWYDPRVLTAVLLGLMAVLYTVFH